ncbi:hypothetical protein BGZ65_000909, partial [Modicella reniformis]
QHPTTSTVESPPSSRAKELEQLNHPEHYFTAAAVFGAAAVPNLKKQQSRSQAAPRSTSKAQLDQKKEMISSLPPKNHILTQANNQLFPSPPKQIVQRTASPSNLATMKPSDYPSCWVDFEIQFEFASPVHASMSSLFFDHVSKEMLMAFINRAETLYGKR